MGFVVLAALTVLSVFAALNVAVRIGPWSRAMLVVITTIIWNFLLVFPIYLLGYLRWLTPVSLGLLSFVLFVACVAVCAGRDRKKHIDEVDAAARQLWRLPWDCLVVVAKDRGVPFVSVVTAFVYLVWSVITTYLAPSYRGWDAFWYHEPMVAWTIQNHGFMAMDLPQSLQNVNAYPRLAEMTQLWFVIFTDRRLLELTNSLVAPGLMAGTYVLCRRYGGTPAISLGFAGATILLPVVQWILQSVFVDVHVTVFILAGLILATEKEFRIRDGILLAIAISLSVGAKLHAIYPCTLLLVIGVARAIKSHFRTRRAATLGLFGAATAIISFPGGSQYVYNWIHFKNPFWPELKVDVESLGIHWPGTATWGHGTTNFNEPLPNLFEHLFAIPFTVTVHPYSEVVEYGIGIIWVILPLAAIMLVFAIADVIRRVKSPFPSPLWVAAPAVLLVVASPALTAARYHIYVLCVAMALIVWGSARYNLKMAEGALAALVATNFMIFYWSPDNTRVTPKAAWTMAKTPYPEREVRQEFGSAIDTETGIARERELTDGKLLVFGEDYGGYVGLYWNTRHSNRVVHIKMGADYFDRADQMGATWAWVGASELYVAEPEHHTDKWEYVGPVVMPGWGNMYRRRP